MPLVRVLGSGFAGDPTSWAHDNIYVYIVAAHPMRLSSVISWEIGVRVVT